MYKISGRIRVTIILCLTLILPAVPVCHATPAADNYLAAKKAASMATAPIDTIMENASFYIGRHIELTGRVNGIVSSSDSTVFLLNCGKDTFIIKAETLPKCVVNGNNIRALLRIGTGCTSTLSDLILVTAAYECEVSSREEELKPKPAKPAPVVTTTASEPKSSPNPRKTAELSSRAKAIYDPYKKAIAQFNPRLTDAQLDTITTSVLKFSEQYRIDPRLVIALILVESGFKPTATSPKGAMGLGQLMPGTASGMGVTNAYDPEQNIEASVRLIRGHLDKYGDLALALSAYNAGPGAVKKYNGVPPYRETQTYIRKVAQLYKALCGE